MFIVLIRNSRWLPPQYKVLKDDKKKNCMLFKVYVKQHSKKANYELAVLYFFLKITHLAS